MLGIEQQRYFRLEEQFTQVARSRALPELEMCRALMALTDEMFEIIESLIRTSPAVNMEALDCFREFLDDGRFAAADLDEMSLSGDSAGTSSLSRGRLDRHMAEKKRRADIMWRQHPSLQNY